MVMTWTIDDGPLSSNDCPVVLASFSMTAVWHMGYSEWKYGIMRQYALECSAVKFLVVPIGPVKA